MNIGSLYLVKKFFWLLFPSKKIVTRYAARCCTSAVREFLTTCTDTAAHAAYWSNQYSCEVAYFSPDSYIVFLEEDDTFKKVLTSDGLIGWTWFDESYNDYFEEVKTEP